MLGRPARRTRRQRPTRRRASTPPGGSARRTRRAPGRCRTARDSGRSGRVRARRAWPWPRGPYRLARRRGAVLASGSRPTCRTAAMEGWRSDSSSDASAASTADGRIFSSASAPVLRSATHSVRPSPPAYSRTTVKRSAIGAGNALAPPLIRAARAATSRRRSMATPLRRVTPRDRARARCRRIRWAPGRRCWCAARSESRR